MTYSGVESQAAHNKLKILILSWAFRPNVGGVETHLTDLTEYLRNEGHTVYVLTYTPLNTGVRNVPLRENLKGLEIHRVRWIGQEIFFKLEPYDILWTICLFPPLFTYTLIFMLRHKMDVIHAHGLVAASIAGPLSRLFKIRAVMSLHGLFEQRSFLRLLSKPVLMQFDSILALSERSKRDVVGVGVSEGKVAIYTHWVDQSLFRPPFDKNEIRRILGFKKPSFIVLFVGRLTKRKGVEVLLKVAEKCPDDIEFVFVGVGPLEDKIRTATKKLGNVKLIGKVPAENLVNYYGAADLVAAPPQYDEGFSRVVLESLSCGTPVLAANKGCLVEMIDESVGKLVYPDVMHLHGQIMYFHRNQKELEKLANRARSYAEERYSKKNAELIMDAYRGKSQ